MVNPYGSMWSNTLWSLYVKDLFKNRSLWGWWNIFSSKPWLIGRVFVHQYSTHLLFPKTIIEFELLHDVPWVSYVFLSIELPNYVPNWDLFTWKLQSFGPLGGFSWNHIRKPFLFRKLTGGLTLMKNMWIWIDLEFNWAQSKFQNSCFVCL